MKTIIATVGAALTALTLCADVDESSAEMEEEEESVVNCGVDVDLYSAYVWRNAVQNDRMVLQPCVWGDFTIMDPFYIGFSIWQNWDLTSRRNEIFKHRCNETDYSIHAGVTAWANDNDTASIVFEIGHDWNVNQFLRGGDAREDYPTTQELYAKIEFENPIVDVYGQASWLYKEFGCYQPGMHYELGLKREFELVKESLSLGADLNVNFGDHRYLYYLYGGLSVWDEYIDDYVEEGDASKTVLGGTTFKLYLTWKLAEWAALKGTIAYTGLLNDELRESWGDFGYENRDLLWGGVSMNLEF